LCYVENCLIIKELCDRREQEMGCSRRSTHVDDLYIDYSPW
jgi:hypothetical protein